jgi:pilus assembly protein CpaF
LRIDESSPMVDARLKNGSRINVVLNPAASNDIVVTIRKFKRNMMDVGSLIKEGTLNKAVADFIKTCVRSRLNIIISGGTSTGKTTFLNVLSNFIRQYERIVTIEETLELNLNLPHVVKLEGRPPNLEGKGGITIRDLVRNSLRMRPDRIVVGEIRGAEAVDVLQAMNTGHSGSMTTVHANSPKDMISRLETMILMSGLNLNSSAARRMIASSVDIIIHLDKLKNGKRVLVRISELKNKSGPIGRNTVLEVKDIFGYTAGEKIAKGTGFYAGKLVHTGYKPDFIEKIKNKGFDFNFKNEKLE